MTCFGRPNGEHLQGVLCLLFSPCVLLCSPFLSLQMFHYHVKNFVVFWEGISSQNCSWKRDECAVLGYVSLGDRSFVVPSFFPLPVNTLTSQYFVSLMSLACEPVSIADPWVGVVYPGFSTQHKNSFRLRREWKKLVLCFWKVWEKMMSSGPVGKKPVFYLETYSS